MKGVGYCKRHWRSLLRLQLINQSSLPPSSLPSLIHKSDERGERSGERRERSGKSEKVAAGVLNVYRLVSL